MNWYLKVLRQYADFSGRARRTEYWMFTLVNLIITIALLLLFYFTESLLFLGVVVLYSLAMIIPGIAVCVRRLHDTGKSGLYFFVSFIPLIGNIWIFVLMLLDSNVGDNDYGPNPKIEK
ncbi:DUF805 domain-containing protein [Falsiporphyromonas endometrii]|uniref:DUF805 domain-containing protein n=1 Tax=Falsiporphyromonas endometrii TaxID=1387297 RepID=A0ABV9KA86_9PORP